MTGGWGTPPGKPVLQAIEETAARLRDQAKEQPERWPLTITIPVSEENTDDR